MESHQKELQSTINMLNMKSNEQTKEINSLNKNI